MLIAGGYDLNSYTLGVTMSRVKKILVEVEVIRPEEVDDELIETAVKALEGKGRYYTVNKLDEAIRKLEEEEKD